jgi:zinc protease
MNNNKFLLKAVIFCCLIGVLALTQFACSSPKPGPLKPTASATPDPQTAVDEILDRYTTAVGGQAAIERVTSYKARGRFTTSLFRETGTYEAWGKHPNKTLSVIQFPRIGTLKKGFDGETRWVQAGSAAMNDEGSSSMADVEKDADIYRAGRIKNLYESMRLEGKARLNGREVNLIEGKPVKGPVEKLLFDAETGLLLRWDMVRRDPKRGNVFVKVSLEDYREVDGVKVPFKVRFAFETFDLRLAVDELQHNVSINDAMFAKP